MTMPSTRAANLVAARRRPLRPARADPALYRRREDAPDLLQHVIARAVHGDALFPDGSWRDDFAALFAAEAEEREWQVWSLTLMGTHYHALLATPDASLSAGLQRAHSGLAHIRNRHDADRRGRLIGTRFKAIPIRDDVHLRSCLRYIPMNPVKAGLCDHPSEWRWSTFSATAGLARPPFWLQVDRVRSAVGATSGADFARFVTGIEPAWLPDPPRDTRDWTRFDAERWLEQGLAPAAVASRLGVSTRRIQQIAKRLPHDR